MNRILLIAALLGVTTLTACSGSKESSTGASYDISWFIGELEDAGASIDTRGSALLGIRAESSARMVVNNLDFVDVYEFVDEDTAWEEGRMLVSSRNSRDVYVKGPLVVVHVTRDGSGVRPILNEILGRTI